MVAATRYRRAILLPVRFMHILDDHPHRRYNPLTDEWILVSPHRAKRPWQGRVESLPREDRPSYDPHCYLCPNNSRAGGIKNPEYHDTFVFENDFGAMRNDTPPEGIDEQSLLVARAEKGICRVVCFSPRHDLTLAEMDLPAIRNVVGTWVDETVALGSLQGINHVQIFENKGELMGCSNPHPHGQIWAEHSLPVDHAKEARQLGLYRKSHSGCLLCDYLQLELSRGERIVCENDGFVVLVPFWAVWPFETMVLGRRHAGSLTAWSADEQLLFADILKRITTRYDNLFEMPFPYSSGIHQMPTDGAEHPEWHLHMHFYPPLLRSATVKKFMVGYEMLANPQRDITAESAAARLREQSETHYKRPC